MQHIVHIFETTAKKTRRNPMPIVHTANRAQSHRRRPEKREKALIVCLCVCCKQL